ncbi:hypothetical protein ACWD5R_23685 [Streptomyces sp. NPDC002514]|uniref:hypothetical protein n=1 Tax=unclassified Streptomyces TaxID=2593676 RepID=UPI003692D4DD
MAWGPRSDKADREALERALGAARRHGLGGHVMTQGLGSRITGLGCVSALVALVLLLPGTGPLAGPYGGPAKAVATALVVPAIALPVVAIRVEGGLAHRDTRLHVFDGGLVVTGPERTVPCGRPDFRIDERVEHGSYGSAGHGFTARRLHLSAHGAPLWRLNANNRRPAPPARRGGGAVLGSVARGYGPTRAAPPPWDGETAPLCASADVRPASR